MGISYGYNYNYIEKWSITIWVIQLKIQFVLKNRIENIHENE